MNKIVGILPSSNVFTRRTSFSFSESSWVSYSISIKYDYQSRAVYNLDLAPFSFPVNLKAGWSMKNWRDSGASAAEMLILESGIPLTSFLHAISSFLPFVVYCKMSDVSLWFRDTRMKATHRNNRTFDDHSRNVSRWQSHRNTFLNPRKDFARQFNFWLNE